MEDGSKSEKRQHLGFSVFRQFIIVFSALWIMISDGMHVGWPSPSLPLLIRQNSTVQVSSSDGSSIVVMLYLGQPLGCITAMFLMERIGKKRMLLICSPVSFISWLIIAYAPTALWLKCVRFCVGIAEGIILSTMPVYISEFADKEIRGLLCSLVKIAIQGGLLLINVIGTQFSIRETALIASAVPVLHFVLFIWMPESRHFLTDEVKGETGTLLNSQDEAPGVEKPRFAWKVLDIFRSRTDRKALLLTIGLYSVYNCSGYSAITFYCLTIFNEAGGYFKPSVATIIYFTLKLTFATISGLLVDTVGRRPLLIVSVIGSCCALTVEGVYFYLKNETNINVTSYGFVPVVALLVYIIFFSSGLATVPIVLMSELYSHRCKPVGVSVTFIVFALLVTVVSKFFQIIKDEYGMHTPFFAFAVCCACGLVYIIYFIPETKGKTYEEIQSMLMSR